MGGGNNFCNFLDFHEQTSLVLNSTRRQSCKASPFYYIELHFLSILNTVENIPEIPLSLLSFYFCFSKYLCMEVFEWENLLVMFCLQIFLPLGKPVSLLK